MTSRVANQKGETPPADCLVRAVSSAFSADHSLEAVTIDQAHKKISVATIGRTDESELAARVTATVEQAQSDQPCGLLAGEADCQHCAAPLSAAERQHIQIKREGDVTTIARVTCPTAPKFWRWRDLPLPRFVPREMEFHEDHEHIGEWKWQLGCAALCLVFGLLGFGLAQAGQPTAIVYGCYALAYLAGSWFAAEELWERLREQGGLDVHFLMLAVAAGAAAVGRWNEGVTLLFLFSFAGALEHYALERTQREISSLFHDAPKVATLLDERGGERDVPVDEIRAGMRLLVKPGGQFPVDAAIAKGATAADESNLTGEATPVEKSPGDPVLAGTINLWGAVEVTATRPAAESALQKIIQLIKEAQRHKAPAQRFTDKFSAVYTYVVIAASFGMFFVWWLGMGLAPFKSPDPGAPGLSAFYRTMTLLVVSSPCALVLSIPSAVLAAIAWGARHGILIRGGAAVEKLAEIDTVALDKTGTLTTGELAVQTVESFPAGREAEVARLAYSLEKLSTHPLARAITRYGTERKLEVVTLEGFESVTGLGLKAKRDGKEVLLGRREWVAGKAEGRSGKEEIVADGTGRKLALTPALSPAERENVEGASGGSANADGVQSSDGSKAPSPLRSAGAVQEVAGLSEVWVSEGDLLGRIVLRDDVRPEARGVMDELRRAGLRSVVLTGDRQAAAEHLRQELHLDEIRAELKPEDKVAAVRALSAGDRRVAMVGDGVNDAPSLAAAHVGVAMGARGADAALEQADVVLMHDRLENFVAAYRLSQRARRIIRQNLVISLGTVVVLVAFASLGKIPLPIGVIGHEGSTVVVVMNSLRLLLGNRSQRKVAETQRTARKA